MPSPLLAAPVGTTTEGLDRLVRRLDSMERQIRELRASVGADGATFSENGVTVEDGGSVVVRDGGDLTGQGGGSLDWDGSASFGGETEIGGDLDVTGSATFAGDLDVTGSAHLGGTTTIDGTLNLAAGIVGDSALASQITARSGSQSASGFAIPKSWTTLATASVSRPSWATSAIVLVTGSLYIEINDGAYSNVSTRISGTGGTGPEQGLVFHPGDMGSYAPGTSGSTMIALVSSPPATLTFRVQASYSNSAFNQVPARAANRADVTAAVLFLR